MNKFIPRVAGLALTATLFMGSHASFGQEGARAQQKAVPRAALDYLRSNKQALKLTEADLADIELSSETVSAKSGVKHFYLQQMHQGIEIHNAVTNISLSREDKVIALGDRFQKNVGTRAKAAKAKLTAEAAVTAAARHLNLALKQPLVAKQRAGGKNEEVVFTTGGISLEPIPAKLVYQPMPDGSLRLAWEVSIYELDAQNWWDMRVDANTGEVLEKDNLVTHCEFDNDGPGGLPLLEHSAYAHAAAKPFNFASVMAGTNVYNVYAMPEESPSHGPRSLVSTSAADAIASKEGWHHTLTGKLTTTRGNNVYAYEDPNNNNSLANYSPNGGPELNFDYPVDFTKQPVDYRDAAITNLFYWNNVTHDVWYQYGFDEASGNFQADNFNRGGAQGDYVRAEAQDSRNVATTRNNANFSTPIDNGIGAPRMQMYLWTSPPDANMFRVTSPAGIAGSYPAVQAAFGPRLNSTPITGKLVLGNGIGGLSTNTDEGCGPHTNAASIAGNIAVVYRGNCDFSLKVYNAQLAGAIAVVVINNQPGTPISMGAGAATPAPIAIPSLMISDVAGAAVRAQLNASQEVRVSLKDDGRPELDGDFDNGIIVHEYGHGISTRLTGGRLTNCLGGQAEQAGEGWSDWFGLMMTMKGTDTRTKVRGIGTYAQGQPTNGQGIRPAPYSTDFAVNNYTYGRTNNTTLSQPHGIGFVWATVLWDMTWDLIDKYGYDANLYTGKKGNNMAMQLVIDGLKMQPCAPGFVDGRDAILKADLANYGGANQELIWRAFAKRGVGFSASQGAANSRIDQVEAFDLPPVYACTAPTITLASALANFPDAAANTIYLGYGPQSVQLLASKLASDPEFTYTWSPAAGLSATNVANPVFTPTAAGTYTFTVTAVNANVCTRTASITIKVMDVRCGKNRKVAVCFKGKEMCVDAADATALLNRERGEATIGACGTQARGTAEGTVASAPLPFDAALTAAPNPANAKTTLAFTLAESGAYRLEVVNTLGAVVSVVAQGNGEAGETLSHEFSRGNLAAGLYMARLVSGGKSHFTRIVLQD
ncbi:T9SS-dependent M36 family metallopeptidase [Hymenobacter arizonensis]|uniref:Por secretion system C-terminal sorting domain-containing protein n=1 Tax=Hymenobacter arizonensis TaxID=1227077 RepID=A0A1I5YAT7_HYMAR|nr:T9SS-dependent M36 family metallopeptidase [Hymenobacter arizonensis]SFQ41334.1 Por secretion system C-terminal sorting domain-containing protein [Hymenobacter arizonensis]